MTSMTTSSMMQCVTCDFDEVLFLSSVLWFFLTGVGMSGYSTPDNCTSGLSSNSTTAAGSNPDVGGRGHSSKRSRGQ